jgi:hypothetical protein
MDFIEDNKDKMTDRDYMTIMDGMKTIREEFDEKVYQASLPAGKIAAKERRGERFRKQKAENAEKIAAKERRVTAITCSACGGVGHDKMNHDCPARHLSDFVN